MPHRPSHLTHILTTLTRPARLNMSSPQPLRILMLHGYTQTGPLFRTKTRALEKLLVKSIPRPLELVYPTAPILLQPSDIPTFGSSSSSSSAADEKPEAQDAFGWWVRDDHTHPPVYTHLQETCLPFLAQVLREQGPFDGVLGFSQGGCLAGMVASLLDAHRVDAFTRLAADASGAGMPYPTSWLREDGTPVQPPLRFAISYSGFAPTPLHPLYRAFYAPAIKTPMLHFIGSLDTVVVEERSLALAHSCEEATRRVVYHAGGHFVPATNKHLVGVVAEFINQHTGHGGDKFANKEESVEDMDVPF